MTAKTATRSKGGAGITATKKYVTLGVAWFAYACALVAGALLPGTPPGRWVTSLCHWGPMWITVVTAVVMVGKTLVDIGMDWEPNRTAVWNTIFLFSVVAALSPRSSGHGKKPPVTGKLAAHANDVGNWILAHSQRELGNWLGTTSVMALTAAAIALAVVLSRRTMPRKAGGA